MKHLNELEFEHFLNALFFNSYYSEEFYAKLKLIGVDPNHWPNYHVKNHMIDFSFLRNSKGLAFAKIALVEKTQGLETYEIPKDDDLIKELYWSSLRVIKAKELGSKILRDPTKAQDLVFEYNNSFKKPMFLENLYDGITPTMKELQDRINKKESMVLLPGFHKLSKAIGGFNPKRVSLVSAISGFGKTKLAINLAASASKIMKVLYFNMEMGREDFVALFVHQGTGITNTDWYEGNFNPEKVAEFANSLNDKKQIMYTDGRSLSVDEICSAIYSESMGEPKLFVVIDYDQKIVTRSNDEEWRALVRAVEKFEDIAKVTNSHIVMLAQADDSGDIKASKRSKQPASAVLNFFSEGEGHLKKFFIKAIKNRFGRSGFVMEMEYNPASTKVFELDFSDNEKKRYK